MRDPASTHRFGALVAHGAIWDAFYDLNNNSWNLQKINMGGCTTGPATVGFPFVSVYWDGNQQHVFYRGTDGTIWDSWYDGGSNSWKLQKINAGGCTNGPLAVSDPSAGVYGAIVLFGTQELYHGQQHVAYRDASSNIWDSFYDAGSNSWNLSKINTGGCTNGPASLKNPFIWTCGQQAHLTYPDFGGRIWDSWYDGYVSPVKLTINPNAIVLSYTINLNGPDTGSITGWANLTLGQDGSYNYSGFINNSNVSPYNVAVLFAIGPKSPPTIFTFGVQQSVNGYANWPSSRTWNWDNSGNNAMIKELWANLVQGVNYHWNSSANIDLASLWASMKTDIGYVQDIVKVVGSLG